MPDKLQSVRGMRDILPEESVHWRDVESRIINVLDTYAYQEIRLPVVERTELYISSIGEHTDIVAKEMYRFTDRNSDDLSLRPEGTAGCVRAGLQHGLFHNQTQRFWYMGPMFRHERPQKGRYRQFHQIGVEAFGFEGPDIDAEVILLSARLWRALGIKGIGLQLNSLGTVSARAKYRQRLVEYFSPYKDQLDADSRRQLQTNPLRILDSKNPDLQTLVNMAPVMEEYLDENSRNHFDRLQNLLRISGIEYSINPRLVRGLDYYNETVFEWVIDGLGSQNTVCAGGRYNSPVERFSDKPLLAFGFALGMERLLELVKNNGSGIEQRPLHGYFIRTSEDKIIAAAMKLLESLRDQLPQLRIMMHCGRGDFRRQFKYADKSGALIALILGSEELEKKVVKIKFLRGQAGQKDIAWDELGVSLSKYI